MRKASVHHGVWHDAQSPSNSNRGTAPASSSSCEPAFSRCASSCAPSLSGHSPGEPPRPESRKRCRPPHPLHDIRIRRLQRYPLQHLQRREILALPQIQPHEIPARNSPVYVHACSSVAIFLGVHFAPNRPLRRDPFTRPTAFVETLSVCAYPIDSQSDPTTLRRPLHARSGSFPGTLKVM